MRSPWITISVTLVCFGASLVALPRLAQPQAWAAGHADAIATLMRRTLTRCRGCLRSGRCEYRVRFAQHDDGGDPMPGKRVQFDEETCRLWSPLGRDLMKTFQELTDEAFGDLL